MNRLLLTLVVAVAPLLFGASIAHSQYLYLDISGDGACDWQDYLISPVTSVDVWLDTSHNQDGSEVQCAQDAGSSMTISSYEFILQVTYAGSVDFGAWTDEMGFPNDLGMDDGGYYVRIARSAASALPAGKYRLGSLAITVAGSPRLWPVPSVGSNPAYHTGFTSDCPGVDSDHFIKYVVDFSGVCGTSVPDATETTTWGKIKEAYR